MTNLNPAQAALLLCFVFGCACKPENERTIGDFLESEEGLVVRCLSFQKVEFESALNGTGVRVKCRPSLPAYTREVSERIADDKPD